MARDQSSLGDFDVSATRVPDWYETTDLPLDTSGWSTIDVTNSGDMSGIGCTVADPADNSNDDSAEIQCAIDNTGSNTVIYLPTGTYNFKNNGVVQNGARTGLEIKGDGPDNTVIRASAGSIDGRYGGVCNRHAYINFCGKWNGNLGGGWKDWTAGTTRGTTVLTLANVTGLSVGDWLKMQADDSDDYVDNCKAGDDDLIVNIARISAVDRSTNRVTIDRPLRFDFRECTGTDECGNPCHGLRVSEATVMLTNMGVRDLRIQQTSPDSVNDVSIGFFGVVYGWVYNVVADETWQQHIKFKNAHRNLIQTAVLTDVRDPVMASNYAVSLEHNSVDNQIENIGFRNAGQAVSLRRSHGNMIGYTVYVYDPSNPAIRRHAFFHGYYNSENLVEGNHSERHKIDLDNYWGRQGPRNTMYRNRLDSWRQCYNSSGCTGNPGYKRGSDCALPSSDCVPECGSGATCEEQHFGMTNERDKSGPTASYSNYLANTAGAFFGRKGCGSGDNANSPADCFELDENSTQTYVHLEKNVYRSNLELVPSSTTHCGGAEPNAEPDCPGDNHFGQKARTSWRPFDGPDSLYLSSVPSWWCEEACPFGLLTGIGAFGDDYDGTLCRLPAQILLEGGTCTLSGADTRPPTPPILLQD